MKILLVEDDEPTAWVLSQALKAHHYIVTVATDGEAGLDLAQAFTYDLLLLDVMLPKIDGITLCRHLRSKGYQRPILLLTAKDSNSDRILGLDAGADDYIVKPFDLDELVARLRALLRRGTSLLPSLLTWGKLGFDTETSEVNYGGKLLCLTPKEYSLLKLLLLNPQRIFSRRAIIDRLWSDQQSPGEETVTTHVKNLRQKLKAAGASTGFIKKVYGLGYRLQPLSELGAQEESSPKNSPLPPQDRSTQQQVLTSVTKLWEKYQSKFTAQVEVLVLANNALNEGRLTEELQEKAKQEAHRLAGSLGIFGFAEGSKLARLIEQILETEVNRTAQTLDMAQYIKRLQQKLSQPPTAPTVSVTLPKATPFSHRILVIDDDVVLTELLKQEATAWRIEVEVALSLKAGREAIAQISPDLILLDLTFPASAQNGLTLLRERASLTPQIPILAFTSRDSLSDRVEVARLGGRGFLQKPISTEQIFTTINQILNHPGVINPKVMVVDDDPNVLASLSILLNPWGIDVTTLINPEHFWEVLSNQAPDLLILDLKLPCFSGLDLCQVVRNDPQWQDLPIVFFTSDIQAETIERIFAAGADDYISKSVVGQELVSRILNRLKRVRRRQQPLEYR